jgi:hypothetical protein
MSTAAIFLIVATLAAIGGSLLLYFGHRLRQPRPLDFHEQLRAIAPQNPRPPLQQPSGIVPLEPGPDEER